MAAVANYYECSGFTECKCTMHSVAQILYMSLKWLSWQSSILWYPVGGIPFLTFCSWSAPGSLCGPLAPSSKWIIGLNTTHSLTLQLLLPRLHVIRFDLLGECRTTAPWKSLQWILSAKSCLLCDVTVPAWGCTWIKNPSISSMHFIIFVDCRIQVNSRLGVTYANFLLNFERRNKTNWNLTLS